jgi:hypothetical protein
LLRGQLGDPCPAMLLGDTMLRIRWEIKGDHYLVFVHMACAFIAFRAAKRRNGHKF